MFQEDIGKVYEIAREVAREEIAKAMKPPPAVVASPVEVPVTPEVPQPEEF